MTSSSELFRNFSPDGGNADEFSRHCWNSILFYWKDKTGYR